MFYRLLFRGFVRDCNRSKNHLKRKLLPVKKIQHKPPARIFKVLIGLMAMVAITHC